MTNSAMPISTSKMRPTTFTFPLDDPDQEFIPPVGIVKGVDEGEYEYDLIKENFWISLAIYLVAMLIFSFSSGIISFIRGIITEALSYFTTKEINTGLPIVGAILNLIEYFFYIIFFISAGFQYYTLVEIRDGTGLSRRLEDLGGNVHPNKDIEEQF